MPNLKDKLIAHLESIPMIRGIASLSIKPWKPKCADKDHDHFAVVSILAWVPVDKVHEVCDSFQNVMGAEISKILGTSAIQIMPGGHAVSNDKTTYDS